MPEDKLQSIKNAALSGNMITAIKLYREAYGVGLAEAKHAMEELVDAWGKGEMPTLPPLVLPAITASSTPSPSGVTEQLKSLVMGGQTIAAIKLYRDHHRVGLKEAKEAIDRLEAELRLRSPESFTTVPGQGAKNCLVLVLFIATLAYGVWLFLH